MISDKSVFRPVAATQRGLVVATVVAFLVTALVSMSGDPPGQPEPSKPSICFVCTGNFYRSRFAEEYFNAKAKERGFPWHAESRGTAIGVHSAPRTLSPLTVEYLKKYGIEAQGTQQAPRALSTNDVPAFALFVAINGPEHEAVMRKQYRVPGDKLRAWDIQDVGGAPADQELPRLAGKVDALILELAASTNGLPKP